MGESRDAGDGARKYALTKRSMSALRQVAGRELAKAIESYRNRNAYVVAVQGNCFGSFHFVAPVATNIREDRLAFTIFLRS